VAFQVELHPEAVRDFDALDGSIQKEVAKKIDALSENPFLGKPIGNKLGMDLTGFFKLYAAGKKYRIIYRLLKDRLEVVEIIGIGKREKEKIYKLIVRRLQDLNNAL
jgi:mRNA interferase RelE/StbE